ncbi:MFS transporter [Nocardioides sp. C4-1]|uniref:MFS transporter n=1 Tax=Nocardioides sp. C4-1 TaxID=3151851 RepID=UPI003265AFB9
MSGAAAPVLDRRSRALLVFCAVAVAFAAVDTYVVVLALPDMMATVGISVDQLQRAAPIVSGFLLGYVAMLPLIGRIADLRGPVPVLAGSLVTFAVGSAVTAVSWDLASIVVGRFFQGVGGGGLVPATMALVAALYPVEHRGLPLGLVSAVQEFGSVLGPLFGAAVLAFTSWQGIFAINCAGGVLLWVAVRALARATPDTGAGAGAGTPPRHRARTVARVVAVVLTVLAFAAVHVTVHPVESVRRDIDYGEVYVPLVNDGGRWTTPVGVAAIGVALLALLVALVALDRRRLRRTLAEVDLTGAVLLAVALGGIVLAFATADPEVSVFSDQGPWFLVVAAAATVALVVHLRRDADPLVPRGALGATPAWGSLVVSLLVGWALIAALVDIPLFARTAERGYDQLDAALVLMRFLVALPVGAVVGGLLVRHVPAGVVTAVGMAAASASFWWMSTWDTGTLASFSSNVPLVLGGLGFGLALAPVNAAMLASTRDDAHGIASALVVVARMVGMLVGISVLTTYGLAQLYDARRADPSLGVRALGILQEQAVFSGGAVVAAVAAVLALVLFRGAATRAVDTRDVLRSVG